MSSLEKQLKQYYKEIEKALLCKRSMKKTILSEMRTNVECYIESNPSIGFDDVVSHFGTASAIAQSHLECTPTDELQRRIRIRNRVVLIVVISAIVALLIYIGALTIETCRFNGGMDGYAEITIEDVNSDNNT